MDVFRADLRNVDELARMNKRLIEDEKHPNPMNVRQLSQRMSDWLQGEYDGYIVSEENTTVAYCIYRDDGDYFYMRQLYVEREWRRTGIATKFLDWMYQNVWTEKPVRLDVLAHNEEAISFYKTYGFRVGCFRMEK